MDHDLIVRGGNIADGKGGALYEGDVAVTNGKISAVGEVSGKGREEIDAKGKLVTPGFVDIHTHYDGQATWDTRLAPSSWHGVTTVVMGNCGVGFAPVHQGDHARLIELMEALRTFPASRCTKDSSGTGNRSAITSTRWSRCRTTSMSARSSRTVRCASM
ncbi:MAG: amidohydrolase family protein [Rhizomicrobium sp.]